MSAQEHNPSSTEVHHARQLPHSFINGLRGIAMKMDTYFRREDTHIAQTLHKLSPLEGHAYLYSPWKRTLDLTIAIPSSIASIIPIAALAIAVKLQDGGPMFYIAKRVSHGGDDMNLIKIRTMREGSDSGSDYMRFARGKAPDEDPRCTPLGKFMRKHQLEELPQLFQVVFRKLSLCGFRPIADYGREQLKQAWSEDRFVSWQQEYSQGLLGLSGTNQTLGSPLKKDEKRFHLDMFYPKHARLNLDFYIMWRTFTRLTKLIE